MIPRNAADFRRRSLPRMVPARHGSSQSIVMARAGRIRYRIVTLRCRGAPYAYSPFRHCEGANFRRRDLGTIK